MIKQIRSARFIADLSRIAMEAKPPLDTKPQPLNPLHTPMPRTAHPKQRVIHPKTIRKTHKKKPCPDDDGPPPSEADLLTIRMMNRFHDRWADRDEVYENFVNLYGQWRKFSGEAVKQLEGRRRRYVCEENLARIFEEGLLRHRPRVGELERGFGRLEVRRVVGVKTIRNDENSDVDNEDEEESDFEVPIAKVEMTKYETSRSLGEDID
jgi:hypothetical protein